MNRAGTVTLTIKLKGAARAELAKLGHATVSIVITFTPRGSKPKHETIKVKVKLRNGRFS